MCLPHGFDVIGHGFASSLDLRSVPAHFGLDHSFSDGLDDLTVLLELLDARIDEAVEVAKRRRHETEKLCERRDDRTDELAAEHVDGRQLRELVDVVARERLALEDPASQA